MADSDDDELFNRLRALRPQTTLTSIDPSRPVRAPLPTAVAPQQAASISAEDDLTARFSKLRSFGNAAKSQSQATESDGRVSPVSFAADTETIGDDALIEELMQDMARGGTGPEGWSIGRGDVRDADALLAQAKAMLAADATEDSEKEAAEDKDEADEVDEVDEEHEAMLYVSRALDEAEASKGEEEESRESMNSDNGNPEDGGADDHAEDEELALPSAPTKFISSTKSEDASGDGLNAFPAAPSTAPAARVVIQKGSSQATPKFTDEEIESWCIICSDDATLQCKGCGNDLYCRTCWLEGHTGEGAGFEERRHRAVAFVKDGGKSKESKRAIRA